MNKPTITEKKPKKTLLEKDKDYFWCSCGRSTNGPFCDGSHKGTSFKPLKFAAKESEDSYLCMCKYSKNPPYCDGAHTNLPEEDEVIKSVPIDHSKEIVSMGVPIKSLPLFDDIQLLTAQLKQKPLSENSEVETELTIGKGTKKPLKLKIPIFISDMSFGSLSEESKIALATGAERVETGICSGEGGVLEEERIQNSRYFYELGPAKFGFSEDLLKKVQAFHFKCGQAAKTGIGGHLLGSKVKGKIAEIRGLKEGEDSISPATFKDLITIEDFKKFADSVRDISGGIPIGFKISAQHIEDDIEFAVKASADYIILDGRGGGTGAAPQIIRDNISIPTIPALARARHYLDLKKYDHVTLLITGGLRTSADFIKALALGADGIGISTAALQAIGCINARICQTGNCPAGITTQDSELRKKFNKEEAADNLAQLLTKITDEMKLLSRVCGHESLKKFSKNDLTTWKKQMSELSGVKFSGELYSEK